jgi:O-antigen ligase
MKVSQGKIIQIIDRIGFVFLFVFAASLTTSIFVNQIGYFGALIALLIKFLYQRKFEKKPTGLEKLFVALIIVEMISSILSENSSQSFHNAFKRAILLPVIYLPLYFLHNEKRFKRIFFAFLAFACLGILIYLYFAYRHYIEQIYFRELKGPSPFQYVMTAGGLMSIVTIIMFGFLLQKNLGLKYKLLTLLGITISLAGLLSSYTRAAWVGTAAGIIFLLVLNRNWLLIGVLGAIVMIFFLSIHNRSTLVNYDAAQSQAKFRYETNGRAYSLSIFNNYLLIADYNKGILFGKIHNGEFEKLSVYETSSPAVSVSIYDSTAIVLLLNSQLLFFTIDSLGMSFVSSFTSPGRVTSYSIQDSLMYLSEYEDGYSIVNIENIKAPKFLLSGKFDDKKKLTLSNILVKDNLAFFTCAEIGLLVYDFSNLKFPEKLSEFKSKGAPNAMVLHNKMLFLGDGKYGIRMLDVSNPRSLKLMNTIKLEGNISGLRVQDKLLWASDFGGNLYKIDIADLDSPKLEKFAFVEGQITSFEVNETQLWMTNIKRSRFSSILDPYHSSNIERINQIKVGYEIFKDYPIFGIGNIDLNEVYKRYRESTDKFSYGHLHNNYLHMLAILGFLGFIVFIMILVKTFFIHLETYKQSEKNEFYLSVSSGLFAAFIGVCISGLFEYNFGDHEIVTMFWLLAALSLSIQKLVRVQQ